MTPLSAPVSAPPLRVSIVADLLAEGWPSMDLMAEMLMAELSRHGESGVVAELARPAFRNRLTPLVFGGDRQSTLTIDRIAHRYWDYPRWLRQRRSADVFHIVDHSYAHLALELPPDRVVVTCHDTDAFRTLVVPESRESSLPRPLVARVLRGLRRAAVVACDSQVTRDELERYGLVDVARLTIVPIGVHPSCSPRTDGSADARAHELVGDLPGPFLLHVGSTIPRKRIDTLLDTFAGVVAARPDITLVRVGGAFTREQCAQAQSLGIDSRIRVMPFIERPVLAALYRQSALVLLTSEREGFGLPVVEAMACGTPILVSDLPVLREVGGGAAEYVPVGEPELWVRRVLALLEEREMPGLWDARRAAGLDRAAMFSWSGYADTMRSLYTRVAERRAA